MGVAIAKVKDHLKDRRMVKVMAGLEFVAQRRQRTHCPGAQELPLETGDLREQVQIVPQVESVKRAGLPIDLARRVFWPRTFAG
ncbi:hypothetical protein [Caballeronia sordidicola]|uniref:hypothetical protein n=1 Tax=Caballeronia sordidicola TaxID=196367 RepID=UPI000B77B620|nr:hypothetical protein [Caballeronia sordidicola]